MDLPSSSSTVEGDEYFREIPLASVGEMQPTLATGEGAQLDLAHLSIEQQRLQSGRNRLGTPRHEQRPGAGHNCDTQNQISIRHDKQDETCASVASTSSTLTNTEISNQAPPSYGTATRSCATLDAGQLYRIQLERQQLMLARAQQLKQQHQQNHQIASSSWQDQPTMEHINQTVNQRQQQQHCRLSNFETCATTSATEFTVRQSGVSCARSLGNLAAIMRQQQQAVEQQQQSQPQRAIDDSYGFLSRAQQQQQRVRLCADKDQLHFSAGLTCVGSQVNQQQHQQHYQDQEPRVKKQEEGIYATLNVVVPNGSGGCGPINHVISGRASNAQLERQLQYKQQAQLQWPASSSHICSHHHHSGHNDRPQVLSEEQQTNQLASARRQHCNGKQQHQQRQQQLTVAASFDCAQTATTEHQKPSPTTGRLIDISTSSASSSSSSSTSNAPAGGHSGGHPGSTTNVNNVEQTLRHCAPNSFDTPASRTIVYSPRVTSEQHSSTLTCQNNDFAGGGGDGGDGSGNCAPPSLLPITTGGCDRDNSEGANSDNNRKWRPDQRSGGDLATFATPSNTNGGGEVATVKTPWTTINYEAAGVPVNERTGSNISQQQHNNAKNQMVGAKTAGSTILPQEQKEKHEREHTTGQTTISAHCWLIDSGDELPWTGSADGARSAAKLPVASNYDAAHRAYFRPRAGSIDRLERTTTGANRNMTNKKVCQTLKPKRVHHKTRCIGSSLSSPNVTYNRSENNDEDEQDDEVTTSDCEQRHRRPMQRRYRRRTRTNRTTLARNPGSGKGRSSATSATYESNASTVVRLSAVLNFVSNLVSGRSRSRQRSISRSGVSASKERYTTVDCSGSYNNRTLPVGQSYTSTGPNSMAYSSSTSAYVTGNSSLHSHDCNTSSLLHVAARSPASQTSPRNNRTPRPSTSPFVALKWNGLMSGAVGGGGQPTEDSTIPQQMYTVSIPSTAISHHSYEYCDDLPAPSVRSKKVYDCSTTLGKPTGSLIAPVELLELTTISNSREPTNRKSGQPRKKDLPCDLHKGSCSESLSSAGTCCSAAHMPGLNRAGLAPSGRMLGQTLMSDNELISSAASCEQQNNQSYLSGPTIRRRWCWWNPFKLLLAQRSCHDTRANLSGAPVFSTDEDADSGWPAAAPHQVEATGGVGLSQEPATRYRYLKPTGGAGGVGLRGSHNNLRKGRPSTLQNVISLAKVDRVFRCRLLASLAISLILLALICLLALVIYKRSSLRNFNHLSNGRLSLSVHSMKYDQLLPMNSADYDLSWLWPAAAHKSQLQASVDSLKQPPLLTLNGHNLDGQLRSLLGVIDRSERIQQFQLAITHLTNLQLANDHFIDLTQLAQVLYANSKSYSSSTSNQTISYNGSIYENRMTSVNDNRTLVVTQLELDLASLTLLSNLYWPLVKWRHQSQRSLAANFLSFALSSATGGSEQNRGQPSEGGSDPGASAIRNLLASLILVESFSPENLSQNSNLNPAPSPTTQMNLVNFQRLNQNLRLVSYHLLTCAGELETFQEHEDGRPDRIRAAFCQLLTRRYKRMMLALGELDHNELAELHRREQISIELPASVYTTQDHVRARDKNILDFLLDRLALLDVRLLAELSLSSLAMDNEQNGEQDLQAEMELLVTNQQQIDEDSLTLLQQFQVVAAAAAASGPDNGGENSAEPGQLLLYDLVKATIGDNPMNMMNGAGGMGLKMGIESSGSAEHTASYQELQLDNYLRQFDQLRAEQPDRWYEELLMSDLIVPWPARVLPTFVGNSLDYDLFLHPNLTSRLILGMNKINFEVTRPTRLLVLNCAHLNIIELSISQTKQPALIPGGSSSHTNLLAHDNLSRDTTSGQQAETTNREKQDNKRLIPVRRLLNLPATEMLYIELEETLEPYSSLSVAKQQQQQQQRTVSLVANGVELGELPAQSDQFHATPKSRPSGAPYRSAPRNAFVRNQYVLNISFNKTSLLAERQPDSEHSQMKALEFVQYADYYSATLAQELSVQYQALSQSPRPPPQSHLVADDGTIKSIMFTKFADRDTSASAQGQARHMFPCWDELQFRGKFQLNLVHDYNSQVLFTGQRRERMAYNSEGSLQMTVFEQTPVPLSPSQLALVVAYDLHPAKSLTLRYHPTNQQQQQQHIQVQIWAQVEQLAQTEFASQQLVPQLLSFHQKHLEFAYPLDKIDLVPVPAVGREINLVDRLQESSEGLGLLRFRQPERLLIDVNLASQDQLEQVAAGIAHQLAHQFFGNIITAPPDARWLTEALSEYLGRLALAEVQPEWHLDEQFQMSSGHATLDSEQLADIIASLPAGISGSTRQYGEDSSLLDGAGVADPSPSLELDLDWDVRSPIVGTNEISISKHSALINMMLATLLPTQEARARLLRECLRAHQYASMSVHQFYRHLSALIRGGPAAYDERLGLAGTQSPSGQTDDDDDNDEQIASQEVSSDHQVRVFTEAPTSSSSESLLNSSNVTVGSSSSERVVFVSHRKRNRKGPAKSENVKSEQRFRESPKRHSGRADAGGAPTWLEQAADQWLEQPSFPLISASCYRDHIQLRQDTFRPLAGKWLASTMATSNTDPGEITTRNKRTLDQVELRPNDELRQQQQQQQQQQPPPPPLVWPIPLLFVSRLNPRASRMVWFAERELKVSLFGANDSSSTVSGRENSALTEYGSATSGPTTSATVNRLPQHYSWFKLNHNASSLVRVNYDERNWEALTSLLARAHYSNHLLNPLDRANLLDDAMTLMRYGQLSVNLAMNLTLYLELGERDYQPWSTILGHFDRMQALLNQNPLWYQYVLKLMQPIGIVVGWKDDGPHLMRKLRCELYALAIAYGDEKIVARARQEFRAWMSRSNQFLVPNLQELVYVAGVKYGDQAEWFHCWQRYQQLAGANQRESPPAGVKRMTDDGAYGNLLVNSTTMQGQLLQVAAAARNRHQTTNGKRFEHREPYEDVAQMSLLENEKRQLLTALASTQNTWLLEQFLNYSLDSSKIQSHHLGHVLAILGKNPIARLYLWRHVRLNWANLERSLAGEPALLHSIILESTRHFASELDYDEVSSFFESKWSLSARPPSKWSSQVKHAIRASLATIRANIRWRNSIEPKLTQWLSHYNNNNNNNNHNHHLAA